MSSACNIIGLTKDDYRGATSTLCAGCGHDSVTSHIVTSFFELGIEPYKVAKMSGIGCSGKTTAYFLDEAHGFNGVHGRMPSVTTGSRLANKNLISISISGDGDTGNIGIGQFVHTVRRNVNMLYIVENNGVYGLTKGQFSSTADYGSISKKGKINTDVPIDLCVMAMELGCGFVARSFAGDPKQLVPLIKGGLKHKGLSLLDIISPCVTFNNHEGSTKSYDYVRKHDTKLHDIGFTATQLGMVNDEKEITVDYEAGDMREIELHDGSKLTLKKIARDFDPTNKLETIQAIHEARKEGIILTGLLYVDTEIADLNEHLNTVDMPLYALNEEDLRPSKDELNKIMSAFR